MPNPDFAPPPERSRRTNILGVGVFHADIPSVLSRMQSFISDQQKAYVCVPDVHLIMQSQWDDELRRILNGASMTVTDGMPLVWFCRLAGHRQTQRVYGPDLLLAACKDGLDKGRRHYFYGGAEGVAEALAAKLKAAYPGLVVAGVYSPPFRTLSAEEEMDIAAAIDATEPDVVWVGLGAPKQEYWMRRFRDLLRAPVLVGVGAAFDFHSGAKPQAQKMIRSAGLEWVFRLATEPKRLWPRYRKVIPAFLAGITLQGLGLRTYTLD